LAELNIDLIADLPVGRRLIDHPFYYNAYALQPDKLQMSPATGALLWFSSEQAEQGELDIHISATHLMDPSLSPTGGAIVLATAVVTPESRGTVRLRSRDPREQPEIDSNFLATERDRARMLEGVSLSRRLGRGPALSEHIAFEMVPSDEVQGDEQLAEAIGGFLASYGHPVGTVPMGGPHDEWAVVDSGGAVRGVDGLRVIDASIIPEIPTVATNVTVIMAAEYLATSVYGATKAAAVAPARQPLLTRLRSRGARRHASV
jgi:choline dehydrogenase